VQATVLSKRCLYEFMGISLVNISQILFLIFLSITYSLVCTFVSLPHQIKGISLCAKLTINCCICVLPAAAVHKNHKLFILYQLMYWNCWCLLNL